MNIPVITVARKIDAAADKVTAICEIEGGEATYESGFPVIITCNDRLNEPRYPSLKGIMASKKKQIDTKKFSDLGVGKLPSWKLSPSNRPRSGRREKFWKAKSPSTKSIALVNALHNEAKVL